MKAYSSIIIFILLVAASVITGTGNYMKAQSKITSDLNQALMYALAEKGQQLVTADTIRVCRQLYGRSGTAVVVTFRDKHFCERLTIPELRDSSYIAFAVLPAGKKSVGLLSDIAGLCGDTVVMRLDMSHYGDVSVAFRAGATCSFATVLGLSDQQLPAALCVMSLIWGVSVLLIRRRDSTAGSHEPCLCSVGNLSFDSRTKTFYNSENKEIRFTPMQFSLMEMFFNAEGHQLLKTEICQMLWPGKDDASETLYTLMRRLKRVVGQNTNLQIEVDRGKAYRLKVKSGE